MDRTRNQTDHAGEIAAPNRKAAHNARVRQRILDAAAGLFRKNGYDGTSIDDAMQAADLTRGAFYAHFRSKSALFAAVLEHSHPLLRRLSDLEDSDRDGLSELMRNYLEPAHLAEVSTGCTLVALAIDAARQPDEARLAYGNARARTLAQIVRCGGPHVDLDKAALILAISTGSLQAAAADADPDRQAMVLRSAQTAVARLIAGGDLA